MKKRFLLLLILIFAFIQIDAKDLGILDLYKKTLFSWDVLCEVYLSNFSGNLTIVSYIKKATNQDIFAERMIKVPIVYKDDGYFINGYLVKDFISGTSTIFDTNKNKVNTTNLTELEKGFNCIRKINNIKKKGYVESWYDLPYLGLRQLKQMKRINDNAFYSDFKRITTGSLLFLDLENGLSAGIIFYNNAIVEKYEDSKGGKVFRYLKKVNLDIMDLSEIENHTNNIMNEVLRLVSHDMCVL